jgi:cation transport ATPase
MAKAAVSKGLSMNPALTKTAQIFAVGVFSFILGGWSFLLSGACVEFRNGGGRWAWIAVIGCIVALIVSLFGLMRDAWKPQI